jgi:hypothetical protein
MSRGHVPFHRLAVDNVRGMNIRRVVVDHTLFVVADLEASRQLYTAALAPLGYQELQVQTTEFTMVPRTWTTSQSTVGRR